MGRGFTYVCSCGYNREFYIGIGFGFIIAQEKLLKKIRSGKYGKDMKRICSENKDAHVSADKALYRCPKCGFLNDEYVLDLYLPAESENSAQKLFTYSHICPECKSEMDMIYTDDNEDLQLNCPECGKKLTTIDVFYWD